MNARSVFLASCRLQMQVGLDGVITEMR